MPADARIVCLVPSITELICDLGLASRLVGRTGFCIHPWETVRQIPKVGGTKDVKLEKVRELAPTHVVVNVDENRREDAEALAEFVPEVVGPAAEAVDGAERGAQRPRGQPGHDAEVLVVASRQLGAVGPGLRAGADGVATGADFLDRFFVPFLPAPPLLVRFVAAFFVPFFAAFLPPPFFVDFLAALADFFAPPRDADLPALFFVPLPPPLRVPLDFLLPFLAAISFAPLVGLSLAHRNKII